MPSSPVTLDFSKAQPIDFSQYAEPARPIDFSQYVQPAKLDMSTYQPLHAGDQKPSGVTLDFSKAQPLQGGAKLDMSTFQPLPGQPTTPPNSFAGQWNAQTQQWEDAEPNTVATQGPTERFARSFNKAVTGAEDPSHFVDNIKQMASQTASDVADEINNNPAKAIAGPAMGIAGIPGASRILQGIHAGMTQTWQRAAEELKNGNITSKEGLLNYVNGMIHAVESGIPVAGPMLSDADKELGAGNVAGAAGTVTGVAAPAVMGDAGSNLEAQTGIATNPAAAEVAAQPSNARALAAKAARTVSDVADSPWTGVISPRLANLRRALGHTADMLEKGPEPPPVAAPGPPTVQLPEGSWSGSVRNPAPVEGQPGAQIPISTAARTTAPSAQVGAAQTNAGAIAPASEDEIAQGLGYKNAIQAQQHVGPDAWRQTYQKIAQDDLANRTGASTPQSSPVSAPSAPISPEPPGEAGAPKQEAAKASTPADVIDSVIPPTGATKGLNMKTKAEVDFYVQKGNIDAAKNAIQQATERAVKQVGGPLADAQEDQAIQASARNNLQKLWGRGRLVEGREQAARNSADRTKVAGDPTQGEQFATRWSRYPLPEADLETNKILGYNPHALPQPYQVETPDPDMQPWGGLPADRDLTAILQRSVDAAKAKKGQVAGK